jgi:hypothetical protein
MHLKGMGWGVDWINLVQDRNHYQASVNTSVIIFVSSKAGYYYYHLKDCRLHSMELVRYAMKNDL